MEKDDPSRLIKTNRIIAVLLCLGYGNFLLFETSNIINLEVVTYIIFFALAFISSIGLFFLKKIFRKAIIVVSLISLTLFSVSLVSYPFSGDTTGQDMVGLVFMSPLALLSLYAVIFLNRSKVKELFSSNKFGGSAYGGK
ncbi:MAG: hypothetical protein V1907_01570 [Candidatus Kerfeldbacteria bacterium]